MIFPDEMNALGSALHSDRTARYLPVVCADEIKIGARRGDRMNDDEVYRFYNLRLPMALYRSLAQAAHNNRRSVNAEILTRLSASFSDDEIATTLNADRVAELSTSC